MQTDPIEQAIQAAGAGKAPRVTPEAIEQAIASEFYFTATDGVLGASQMGVRPAGRARALDLLTICVLVLRNGFTIVGTSAVASPANFDAGIGRMIARRDAVRQVGQFLGYALLDQLAAQA